MRDRKRCLPQFMFYDKTGIQAYLERQAKEGWMLEKMSFGWVFRKIEPKSLHFFVAYFPKKSLFEGDASGEQRLFWDFCEHAGWKLVTTNEQMQIFCNEAEDPVPIETEAGMEVEKIHRSAKKSFLLVYFLLLLSILTQVGSFVGQFRRDPIRVLSDNVLLLMMPGMAMLGVYVVREIVRYFLWYRRAKKAAEEGIFAPTRGIGRGWSKLPFLAAVCILLAMICLGNDGMGGILLGLLAVMAGFTALTVGVSRMMRRRNVSAAINRLTVIVMTVGGFIFLLMGTFLGIMEGEMFPEKKPVRLYEYKGWEYKVYQDELPLTLEDLAGEEAWRYAEHYSYKLTEEESVFLVRREGMQDSLPGMENLPWLRYSVTEVKRSALYDWCRERLLQTYEYAQDDRGEVRYHELRETQAAPWGADGAYRLFVGEEAENTYVLCFGNRIVEINTSWELTEEQMAVVGRKLGDCGNG